MNCYSEETLERAAVRALELGIRFTARQNQPYVHPSGLVDTELQRILSHAQSCVRCSQLLDVLQETEVNLRRELAKQATAAARASEAARTVPRRVALEAISILLPDSDHEPFEDHSPYALAAHTNGAGAEDTTSDEAPVLSLGSSDGRFLVRIFRRASGPGATAILVRSDPPMQEGDSSAPGPAQQPRVAIDIEGSEYTFDEKGVAHLPRFPAQRISLVIR